jgi:hypothetical protein
MPSRWAPACGWRRRAKPAARLLHVEDDADAARLTAEAVREFADLDTGREPGKAFLAWIA